MRNIRSSPAFTHTHTHKHVRVLPFFAKGSKKAGQPGHDDINARMYEEGSKTYASPVSHIRLRFPSKGGRASMCVWPCPL